MRSRATVGPAMSSSAIPGPRRNRWVWILAIVVGAVALGSCQPKPGPALFVVTTIADQVDANPGDGVCLTSGGACSLRAAVMEANRTDSDDFIRLPAGNYVLSLPGDENEAVGGDLDSLHGLVIERSGGGVVTVNQGVAGQRVFEGTWMKVSDITITGGDSDGSGGGVLADQLTLERVTVTANHADGSGGGVEAATSLSVIDSAITQNSASGAGGGARAAGSLLLERTTIGSNDSGDAGGGVSAASVSAAATITDATIEGNTSTGRGGGADLAGPATVLRSRLRGNRATGAGAGLSSSGFVQVTESTFDSNIATGATGTGGGISVTGGTTSLVNSTVSANTASVAGGGVHVAGGSAAMAFSTINDNSSPTGDAVTQSAGAATVTASAVGGGCSGTIASGGANVGSAPSGCGLVSAGDLQGATLDLGPLGLAGGRTPVHIPLPGSVLIDRIDNATAGCATTVAVDQRGQVRPTNFTGTPRCDSGAVETAPVTAVVNDVGDSVDANPGDGICADAVAQCTLRAALGETNAWPGGDNIRFASPGMAVELSLTGAGAGNDTTNLSIEESVDIDGDGATVDANQVDNVLMNLAGTSTIRELTFTGGQASGGASGGAIDNQATLTLIDVTVDGNTVVGSGNGGGIANPGTLTLTTSRVTGNSLASDGAVRGGGGIASSGSLTITGSTIDANSAPGATHKGGGLWLTSAATITASTISNNSTGGNGGGLEVGDAVVLANSTISTNQAGGGGAVSFVGTANPATTILRHSTVTANTATVTANSDLLLHAGGVGRINSTSSIIDGQCGGGTLASGGHNVSSTVSGVGGCNLTQVTDIAGANVRVGPLQDNGGPTRTHKPLGGSRAIDKMASCPTVPTDQRGVARPFRALSTPATTNCDAGAVEYETLITTLSLTVDDGGDSRDQTPGDGICSDGTPAPSCTLRAAIDEVNVWPADDMLANFASMYAADTITIDPSVDDIQLSLTGTPEDANANGDLDLRVRANVVGNGVVIHGTGSERVLHAQCSFGCEISIADLTITGGNTVLLMGAEAVGAGIRVDTSTLTLDRVTVRDNVSGFHGGGIFNAGGAPLTLTNSTISGNRSTAASGQGGGIYNSAGGLVVRNTTISGNSTPSPGTGFASNNAGATLEHVTLTGNTGGGSSSIAVGTGAVNLRNTIVDGTCGAGNLVSQGYNVLSAASGCGMSAVNNDVLGTPAGLGPLQANGGPTKSNRPLYGSPAIDHIPTGTNGCGSSFTSDQRGATRPQDGDRDGSAACDVGAMEPRPLTFVVISSTDTVDATPGDGACADASGLCTLRAAVQEANANAADDEIQLTSGVVHRIQLAGSDEDVAATGDLDITDSVLIRGTGATVATIDGGDLDRGLDVIGGVRVELVHVRTANGQVSAGDGGGLRVAGTAVLTESAVEQNQAPAGTGGGIALLSGRLELHRSTVAENGAGAADASGVSIASGSTQVVIDQSTISANDVHLATTPTAITGSTIDATITETQTVGTNLTVEGSYLAACTGEAQSLGDNVERTTSCDLAGATDTQGLDPHFAALADNGGPTRTLLAPSVQPLVDRRASCPATDQRGQPRPTDGNGDSVATCDVGAVEFVPPVIAQTYVVDTTTDAADLAPGDGHCLTASYECSLRAAIQESNTWLRFPPPSFTSVTETVQLPGGTTYTLTLAGSGEDGGATGDLDITDSLDLQVVGTGPAIIDSNHLDRGLDVRGTSGMSSIAVALRDLVIKNGDVTGSGGGLRCSADPAAFLDVESVTLTANHATGNGGGAHILGCIAELGDMTIDHNTAGGDGGGINGAGAGGPHLSNSTVTENSASAGGGVAGQVRVAATTISQNGAESGGGVCSCSLAGMTLYRSTIVGNHADFGGGVIGDPVQFTMSESTVRNNQADIDGGGVLLTGSFHDRTPIQRTTIEGNTATGNGGGIHSSGTNAVNRIVGSTISGNTAASGGGVWHTGGGGSRVHLSDSTVTANSASSGAGLGGVEFDAHYTLSNSIIADQVGAAPNCSLELDSDGHNLSSDSSCSLDEPSDQQNLSARLDPLADNGGPTQTHLPRPSSPAVDRGAGCSATDQRGQPRPIDADGDGNAACDVGSVEVSAIAPLDLTVDSTVDAPDADPGDGACATAGGQCTLRAALQETNVWPTADTITITSGVHYGTSGVAGAGEDDSATGDLDILDDVTIKGDNGTLAFVDGSASDRVFDVHAGGQLHLLRVQVANGHAPAGSNGGGVRVTGGSLDATEASISFNHADGESGGGLAVDGGSATLTRSLVASNQTITGSGGGVHVVNGTLTVSASTISSNGAGEGAAVRAGDGGSATITDSTIHDNFASPGASVSTTGTGSISVGNSIVGVPSNGPNCAGGAVTSTGHNLVSDASCPFAAPGDATSTDPQLLPGGLNGGITINYKPSAGSPAIDTGNGCGGTDQRGVARPKDGDANGTPVCDKGAIEVEPSSSQSFVVNTSTDGVDFTPGDGICATATNKCTLRAAVQEANASPSADLITLSSGAQVNLTIGGSGEDAAATGDLDVTGDLTMTIQAGGAALATIDGEGDRVLDVHPGVELTLFRVNVQGGTAPPAEGGGGVRAQAGAQLSITESRVRTSNAGGGPGGGLLVDGATVAVDRSLLDANDAGAGSGGAIAVTGGGSIQVTSSTISGNTGAGGGGLHVAPGTAATVTDSTITSNFGTTAGGVVNGGTLTVTNSIVAAQQAGPDCSGTITSGGNNLESATSCGLVGAGDVQNANARLAPLANNGGPTPTHLPGHGGDAVDTGTGCTTSDQRGSARPVDGNDDGTATCDIGAVEAGPSPPKTFTVDSGTDAVDASIGDGVCATAGGACSLRAAVQEANRWPTDDTVLLPPSVTSSLSVTGASEDQAAAGDLDLTDSVTVRSTDPSMLARVSMDTNSAVFEVHAGVHVTLVTVEMRRLTGGAIGIAARAGSDIEVTDSQFVRMSSAGIYLEGADLRVTRSTFVVGNLGVIVGPGSTADISASTFWEGSVAVAISLPTDSALVTDSTINMAAFNDVALSGNVSLRNSIIKGECVGGGISLGHNTSSGGTCADTAPGDQPFAITAFVNYGDPVFGDLADHGGPTRTLLPQPGAPGQDMGGDCAAIDQRGVARPLDSDGDSVATCDVGAVERAQGVPRTFTVTTPFDAVDALVGDGICATAAGTCSLRAAVQESNFWAPDDTIVLPAGQTSTMSIAGQGEDAALTGDLDLTDSVTITSSDPSLLAHIDGEGLDRIFDVRNGARVSLTALRVTDGSPELGEDGGGIRVGAGSDLVISDSWIHANQAQGAGADGGGVALDQASATIRRTLVSGNSADFRGGGLNGSLVGPVTIEASTFSSNGAAAGGGMQFDGGAPVSVRDTTVTDNYSSVGQYPGILTFGSLGITNSVVADQATSGPNCSTGVVSLGFNLSSDDSCSFNQTGDVENTSADLAPLAFNGGPTPTHKPNLGSPVIDTGSGCLPLDQRGVSRPLGGDCDRGAVEQ